MTKFEKRVKKLKQARVDAKRLQQLMYCAMLKGEAIRRGMLRKRVV